MPKSRVIIVMKLRPLVLLTCLSVLSFNSLAATITAVRSWRAPDNTRLVLDLSETVRYRQLSSQNKQLIIELDNTDSALSAFNLPSHVGLVQQVQLQAEGTKQRLIINLNDEVRPHVFLLPANDKYSPRLVIDLFDKVTMQATAPIEEEIRDNQSNNQGRSVIVVVDAGHGGEDSGAIGANGHYEKHVTLAIAKKLVALLRKTDGFKAYLTRDSDYFIPLQDRRKIARNRYKADIFISIHADSAPSPLARGASVFALSRKGATSATSRFAQALAEKENKSDLIGGVDADAGKDSQLTGILADMVVEGSLIHSLHMGGQILGELGDIGRLHAKHVEQAGFAVLKEPGMISLLVETGFISNPAEEARLTDPDGQQQIAQSVFNGIKSFMQKYPMPKSYFAWNKEQRSSKQRAQALQAVAVIAEPKPKSMLLPQRIEAPAVVIEQPDLIANVVAEKRVVAEVVKPIATPEPTKAVIIEKTSEKAVEKPIVIESRALSEPPKAVVRTLPTPAKVTVAATLPSSLDDFMAGVPQPTNTKTVSKNEVKKPITSAPVVKTKAIVKPAEVVNVKAEPKKVQPKAEKHLVKSGDSLSSIALNYGVTVEELKEWNKLKSDDAILDTQLRLTAPVAKEKANTKAKESVDKGQNAEKTVVIVEKNPPKTKVEKTESLGKNDKSAVKVEAEKAKIHRVKIGDSLSSIALKYGVSEKVLREHNQLKNDNVMLDQQLKIPTP